MAGIILEEVENEAKMEEKGLLEEETIGVVFKDDFSYTLRFQMGKAMFPNEDFEHIETCWDFSARHCKVPLYWYGGFLSVQSSIDAAVIEMKTKHSVWREMMSVTGVHLQTVMKPLFKLDYLWFIICAVLSYCPYMHFLSVKVLKEKKRLKVLMRAMGLQDVSFWLSWSLLYTVYVSITASLLTWVTLSEVYNHRSFLELYFFYFFYGMACIHFTFLLSSLLKQPNISSFVGFLLHILFGALGFLTLLEKLPRALEWILNLFSPFAFTAGLAKMVKLEKYGPASSPELYPFYNLYLILSLDSVLYFLLAIYFDKVLPGKHGVPHPPAFFLRPSYWLRGSRGAVGVRAGSSHDPVLGGDAEPMPPGFDGKEAIRLNNIKKIYKKNSKSTEALKGLSLNVYEGQITALLGHSGSGKTALLNVLSGFSKPSAGSAMIYNYNAFEVWNTEGMQERVGVCPQINLHFEALTAKENLRIFAHIKGIQWKEVDEEVQKVLVMMDLTDVQDVCAEALSGGQKRKLSLGIAILGNPQVLLLDEPTAGLDPCSRHHVWSLLRERRAGRVTLVATQSMEEADTQADLFSHLESSLLQGVVSYEVTRTTLEDVFLKLQGEEAIDPEGDGDLEEREQNLPWLSKQGLLAMSGMMLWRQQVCAVLRIHLLRLKHDGKFLRGILLLFGIFVLPPLMVLVLFHLWHTASSWEISSSQYFLPTKEKIQNRSTNLLIFNDTGSEIEDFIAALKIQNITPEIALEKNITSLPNYNGAIKISLEGKLQARSQLRLAGLFPSAYWCGQALVDIPFFWSLLCLMFGLLVLFTRICPLETRAVLTLLICIFGYGISLVLFVYLMAFKFHMGRSNRYIWSLIFILVNYVAFMHSDHHEVLYYICMLIPMFPPVGWIMFSGLHFLMYHKFSIFETWNYIYMPVFAEPPGEEPPEVRAERERVRAALASLQRQQDSVVVNGLRKEYEFKTSTSIFKKRKKLAVKNLSFGVKKGEVLGLLGPNGAGKSTTLNMISGGVAVTAGEVLLRGQDEAPPCPGSLGWCPQQDPLWPHLTVLQHLEAFTAIRGMREEDAALAISCIGRTLDLLKHFKSPARSLSAGEARKLSFALSILGGPAVMLWDEPSVSVDPKGQRRMWYIGSLEDLKRKFGTSYRLELKMTDAGQSDALHTEILNLFPQAARQERTSSMLTYKIPVADALPLSRSFSHLEAAKRNFKLEEYSLSLNTLHQVFVDLTRDAEEHDLEVASNGAVEQRPLQP
ncbi:hypothetical protein EK904_012996 [Melospiza melodia maxima]|nr:hypothetical protein EK904_012996 [Melospiza melodia maxima]